MFKPQSTDSPIDGHTEATALHYFWLMRFSSDDSVRGAFHRVRARMRRDGTLATLHRFATATGPSWLLAGVFTDADCCEESRAIAVRAGGRELAAAEAIVAELFRQHELALARQHSHPR